MDARDHRSAQRIMRGMISNVKTPWILNISIASLKRDSAAFAASNHLHNKAHSENVLLFYR